ncbi:hypothetical protein [Arcicella lustrica]|uniref:Outer membrane lipoprotein carrier protein LolA n=1 Tax=Arcicella lustrica TaxID=2984196 RepID=A0ABU5SEV8_9BACT|nr:hypothetical protein [Arcicella sp. DC25W]MEA5425812.1 hypothetical protein [Arcicella sp. DC25W]
MKKKLFILLFLFLTIKNTSFSFQSQDLHHYYKSSIDTTKIENDFLLINLLKENLSFEYLMKSSFSKKRRFKNNIYDIKIKNYEWTFSNNIDKVKYLSASGNKILLYALIKSPNFLIGEKISVGNLKSIIAQKLKVSTLSDLVIISDIEGSGQIILSFKNEYLNKIEYQVLYLD